MIDSLVNEFSLKHPDVLFVISAGNDGPGLSTVGFPASADLALSVCALFPGVFSQPPDAGTPVPPDVMGYWSARVGELAKPEVCAPGVAYSNVPPWHTGEEISGGTSMAAPQVSGLAAVLQSAPVEDVFGSAREKLIDFVVAWHHGALDRYYVAATVSNDAGQVLAHCDSRLTGMWIEISLPPRAEL